MKELVGQRSDVKYTGIDIVPTLIARHQKNYGNMKNVRFMHMDIVQSTLNESYDIIFCRDMLQHLKNTDVMQVSGIKRVLTLHYLIGPLHEKTGDSGIAYEMT